MCAKMLELTLDKGVTGPPAGVIVEPLQASAGMIPCPKRYLERVREICDQHEVPLIFDEIQTYLRIGTYFAAQYYGVTPDIIGLGKAIGGGLPLGATLIRDGLVGFEPDAEELHTFAANTLSIVGAIKLIEIVQRDKLLDHANRMGSYFRQALADLQQDYPEIGDIRQVGLHIGVEMVADPQTKRPLDAATRQIRDVAIAAQRNLRPGRRPQEPPEDQASADHSERRGRRGPNGLGRDIARGTAEMIALNLLDKVALVTGKVPGASAPRSAGPWRRKRSSRATDIADADSQQRADGLIEDILWPGPRGDRHGGRRTLVDRTVPSGG